MSTLLHVCASPRGEESESLALADTFLEAYLADHADTVVDTLDLWQTTLPAFGRNAASAKMTAYYGGELAGEMAAVWAQVEAVAQRFTAADRYLFSVPMWNFGVPYVLKHWIDVVTQPGILFGFDQAAGYLGLLGGKKAAAIYTSAGTPGAYGTGDFHATFLNDWLRFIGVTDLTEIRFQPALLTPTPDEDRASAHDRARHAGKTF
jgi:FMN-dependent NADH-azoreductase